jgi:hypothetical protein
VGILTWGNDNLIEYNDIHDVVLEFTDMGAIDMNSGDRPFERGTVIRRNFIHHIGEHKPQQNGVYPDNFTMGVLIEENIFYRIGGVGRASDCRAVNVNCGSYIITRHNLLVDCSLPYCLSDHAGGALYEQTVPQWKAYFTKNQSLLPLFGKRYAELLRFWDEPRQYPESNRFERNIILNLNVPRLRAYGAKREPLVDGALDPKKVLKMAGNVAGETPAGVVAPDGKLNLTDNVFGLIPGFPRLSLSEIGPRGRVGPHPGEER